MKHFHALKINNINFRSDEQVRSQRIISQQEYSSDSWCLLTYLIHLICNRGQLDEQHCSDQNIANEKKHSLVGHYFIMFWHPLSSPLEESGEGENNLK